MSPSPIDTSLPIAAGIAGALLMLAQLGIMGFVWTHPDKVKSILERSRTSNS